MAHVVKDAKAVALVVEPLALVDATVGVVARPHAVPHTLAPLPVVSLPIQRLHACTAMGQGRVHAVSQRRRWQEAGLAQGGANHNCAGSRAPMARGCSAPRPSW